MTNEHELAAGACPEPRDFGRRSFNCGPLTNFFAVCTKNRDVSKWAWDHGQWTVYQIGPTAAAGTRHRVWLDLNWSTASRLELLHNSSPDNNGIEVNSAFVNDVRTVTDGWASDLPGAYLETITFDDDHPSATLALGSDRAEQIVAGRWYYNDIDFSVATTVSGQPMEYYGQVDLDMTANGDAGFYYDDSCCSRGGVAGDEIYRW